MGLFDKVSEHKEPKVEPEVIFRDAPKTEGQKRFEEEAERRKQELNERLANAQ